MFKNIVIAILLTIVAVYFWGDSPAQECPKPTPRMEGGCVIQSTPNGEIKTCG
jgi:hypothetical protein